MLLLVASVFGCRIKQERVTLPVYYIYSYTVKIAYFFGTLTIVTVTASAALNGTLDIIYFSLLIC